MLKSWDINDVVNVIDEIDKRVLVVEAISRIYESKTTDELHTLHPMVLRAKWLFGAERVDEEAGDVKKPDQILIVELKKGGFEMTGKEVYQAVDCVSKSENPGSRTI